MDDALVSLVRVGMLTFVVAGMLSMGLELTLASIVAPLRDPRLVVGALVANFVVVPGVTIAAVRLLPVPEASAAALVLVGCCGGAPFLPMLAKMAHGDPGLAVGVMVLLMVVTVGFAPAVVPVAVPGSSVSPGQIAVSLVVVMVAPLGLAMAVRARFPGLASSWARTTSTASTVGLGLGMVAGVTASWRELVASAGTWIFVGTVFVVALGLVVGHLAGVGRSGSDRLVLGLGAAQRNIAAAMVIAASLTPEVLVRTMVAALVISVVLMLVASEAGRRAEATSTPPAPA